MKKLFTDDFDDLTAAELDDLKADYKINYDAAPSDEDIYKYFYDSLEYECEYLYDVLDKIDQSFITNDLLAIADLGLWNGRVTGYKELKNLTDISACMQDYNTLYVERNDLKIRAIHHDGTNYYVIREFKDISDEQRENFLDKIYNGKATRKDITRYTKAIGKTVFSNFYL